MIFRHLKPRKDITSQNNEDAIITITVLQHYLLIIFFMFISGGSSVTVLSVQDKLQPHNKVLPHQSARPSTKSWDHGMSSYQEQKRSGRKLQGISTHSGTFRCA